MSQTFTIRATGSNVLTGLEDNFSNLAGVTVSWVPIEGSSIEAGSVDYVLPGGPYSLGLDWALAFDGYWPQRSNIEFDVGVSGGDDASEYEDYVILRIENFEELDFTLEPIIDAALGLSGAFSIYEGEPLLGSPVNDRLDNNESNFRPGGRDVEDGQATRRATDSDNLLKGIGSQDRFNGLGGDDTIEGEGGNDTLDGGPDDDILRGGPGNDVYMGWSGSDWIEDDEGRNDILLANFTRLGSTPDGDLEVLFDNGARLVVADYYARGLQDRFDLRLFGEPVSTDLTPSEPVLSNAAVSEDARSSVVGELSATSAQGGPVSFRIISDPSGLFTVSGTTLVVTGSLDHETAPSHSVTVQVEDAAGSTASASFTISVLDVDEAPGLPTLIGATVSEAAAPGTPVGQLAATDPEGGPVRFELTDDGGGAFAISGTDLVVSGALDYETQILYTLTARAVDAGGLVGPNERITVAITDAVDPVASNQPQLSSQTVPENAATGTVVGQIVAPDPEGDAVTLTLEDDAGGLFAISDRDLVVAGPLDFEDNPSHVVVIKAFDGILTRTGSFTISVQDLPEVPPADLALSTVRIAENSPVGTVIGRFTATDADGETVSFRLIDDADGRVALEGDRLVVAGIIDFEIATSLDIAVFAEDPTGRSTSGFFTVEVADVHDPDPGQTIVGDGSDNVFVLEVDASDGTAQGGNGNDTVDGLEGRDTVAYGVERVEIAESRTGPGEVSVVIRGGQTDVLRSIERVELNDGTYLYDLRPEASFTYLVYSAALGRIPDELGLRYWEAQRLAGLSDRGLARSFVESREFAEKFGGPDAPLEDYVCALYENILGRPGDPSGKAFWIGEIASGRLDQIDMLLAFAINEENLAANVEAYDDGVWVLS